MVAFFRGGAAGSRPAPAMAMATLDCMTAPCCRHKHAALVLIADAASPLTNHSLMTLLTHPPALVTHVVSFPVTFPPFTYTAFLTLTKIAFFPITYTHFHLPNVSENRLHRLSASP